MESAHRLGSVRQETDATGAVTAVREWSPYGVEVGTARTGLGYTGEWFDTGVGLQYLRARWYDGTTGRFTTQDAWEGDYDRPQSLNGWAYVEGNPVRLVDPSGYTWDEETKTNVRILKEYFLQSAARHNAIPTMDHNGFAGYLINNPGETNSRRRHLPKMPNTGTLRNLC